MTHTSKRALAIAMALCLVVGVSQALAWEFSMQGDWNWEYKYYSQTGENGFFGRYNLSRSWPGGSDGANANGWLGNEILWDRLTSGTDAAASSMYMHLNPEFRINEAVRVRGAYYIGSWGFNPDYSIVAPYGLGLMNAPEYYTNTIPGRQSSFSPGYWNTLWASAQTPWGIVVLGKRPFSFGTGLVLDGEDNTTYEGLLIVVPYGPLRIGGAWMPWTTTVSISSYPSPNYPMADKNAVQDVRVGGFFTYDAGAMSFGAITEYIRWHGGPESQYTDYNRFSYVPHDNTLQYGTAYVKYNNGRFFFNAEGAFIKTDTHRQNSYYPQDTSQAGVYGGTVNPIAPNYIEHARYMIEAGVYSGPAKLSLFWGYVEGGEDRRYGIYVDRQSDTRGLPAFSNYSVFRPYSILFAWNYGSGNGSYTARPVGVDGIGSDNGYVTDANTYAARLDYAVAANLNVYGSIFYAERLSKGYGWGYLNPSGGLVSYGYRGQVGNPAPTIPDSALGYEIDAGFDWKLLEGYTLSLAAGYWAPGKWFTYACADRAVPNWNAPQFAVNFGVNPNRSIDPVLGLDVVLKAEF